MGSLVGYLPLLLVFASFSGFVVLTNNEARKGAPTKMGLIIITAMILGLLGSLANTYYSNRTAQSLEENLFGIRDENASLSLANSNIQTQLDLIRSSNAAIESSNSALKNQVSDLTLTTETQMDTIEYWQSETTKILEKLANAGGSVSLVNAEIERARIERERCSTFLNATPEFLRLNGC